MDLPIHIDTISMCPFCILRGRRSKLLNFIIFLSLKVVFILAYSVHPDEMLQNAAFILGPQCLPKYLLTSIQNEKD